MTAPRSLRVAVAAVAGPSGAEHKRFQSLLARTDQARQRLHDWQQQLPTFAAAHRAQVVPVQNQLALARRAWAFELEQLRAQRHWSKAEMQTLAQMICHLCGGLLSAADGGDDGGESGARGASGREIDAELKSLYNRYAEVDFDAERREQLDSMKSLVEEAGGIDLGDEPVDSVDELMRRARARLGEPADDAAPPRRPARTAAERRAHADQARISQTVRDVYRKLAAALHPEPQ